MLDLSLSAGAYFPVAGASGALLVSVACFALIETFDEGLHLWGARATPPRGDVSCLGPSTWGQRVGVLVRPTAALSHSIMKSLFAGSLGGDSGIEKGPPVVFHGRPPKQPNAQPLRLAGASPSLKDSTTASVASASSEAATVRAPTAFDAASRSPFTDSRAPT